MVTSTMVGMKWKPIDNITKNQPPSSTSTSFVKNAFPGQDPRLLSNGQSAIIQKQTFPSQQQQKQNNISNNKNKFRLLSIDQFKPHVKKEQLEQSLTSPSSSSSSSSTTIPNNTDLTGASDKSDPKICENNNKKNMTQNNNNNNNGDNNNNNNTANPIKIESENHPHLENDNNTDPVDTNRLKKKIKKLQNKIDGYKQNEVLFKNNTNTLTKEILGNQFEISKLYGQLKSLQINNQGLNNLNDYLINDLITTKIDFQRIRYNLIDNLHSNHVGAEDTTVNNPTTTLSPNTKKNSVEDKDNTMNQEQQQQEPEEAEEEAEEEDQNKQTLSDTSSPNNDLVVTKANLHKLENNIMMRLNQYEDLQNSLENQIKENNHLSKVKDLTISMESPYIKRLKDTIKVYNKTLKNLHSVLNNRTTNYQILLHKSEKAFAALEQKRQNDAANMRDYIDKSQKYMQNASIYIAKLEKEKNESNKIISDLQNNLTQQDKKWKNEVAQLKIKLNNINSNTNNNNNNMNAVSVNYEAKIKKLTQELQIAQNSQQTKQAAIELLNNELNKAKNALSVARRYQNSNIPNSDTVTEIINNQKKSYESLLDLAKTEHKREMDTLKTQYLALLNQYKHITTKINQKFSRDSPIIQHLLKEERQKLLNDIQSCLNIICNNPNMRDQIGGKDISNAIYLLNMVTSKLIDLSNNPQYQVNQQTQTNTNLVQQNTVFNNQNQQMVVVKNNINNNSNNNSTSTNTIDFHQKNMVPTIQEKPGSQNNPTPDNTIQLNPSNTASNNIQQNMDNNNNSNKNTTDNGINMVTSNSITHQSLPNNNNIVANTTVTSNNLSSVTSNNTTITTNSHTITNNQNTINTLAPSSFTPINKINKIAMPTTTTNSLDNNKFTSSDHINKNNELSTVTTNATTTNSDKHIETIEILDDVEEITPIEKKELSQKTTTSSHEPNKIIASSSLNPSTTENVAVPKINLAETDTPLATMESISTPGIQNSTNSTSGKQEIDSKSISEAQSQTEVEPTTSTISARSTGTIDIAPTANSQADKSTN